MANDFIRDKIDAYKIWLAQANAVKGKRSKFYAYSRAYHSLGMALHTVMDSTSPAHESFQYWESGEA